MYLCASASASLSVPVPVFACAYGLIHPAPRPTSHVDGDGVAVRAPQTRRRQTTHITHTRTHDGFRRHGTRRQEKTPKTSSSSTIIIFTATPGMSLCRFFPSPAYSESSPRGGCTPYLLSVPGQGTSIQHKSPRLTRLTPLPPPSGPFTVYERPRLPVWSPLPFIISSPRTLSTRYPST